ncbi:MAG: YcaO-like family protein, partial [Lentisphaerota bacterium]
MIQQSLSRTKPYKAASPEQTIGVIQKILHNLGVSFVEEPIEGQGPFFSYCLRVVDATNHQTVFQTMGKGLTDAYARASAYGELIERLQNLAFFIMLKYPTESELGLDPDTPFKYFPDERFIAWTDLSPHAAHLFRKGSPGLSSDPYQEQRIKAVPFWNVFGGQMEYLPFRHFQLVVGSNGMCSGNTKKEALIHGLCEVFERHVLKRMFTNPFCPPPIPPDLFSGHAIHQQMRRLMQDKGCDISIKDCSLGKRLPVLGLLITDRQGRYAFHLGADPSPVTALERCFTEMFQGGAVCFNDGAERPDTLCDLSSSSFWRMQLHLNIRSYQGHWPSRLFSPEPDYAFNGFAHPSSISDAGDLQGLLQLMKTERLELLIRDNSFLGFPSYHVYLPGLSEMSNVVDHSFVNECLLLDRHLPALTRLHAAGSAQKQGLAAAIASYAAAAPSGQFRVGDYLAYYPGHPVAGLSQEQLAALLCGALP